MLLRVLVPPHRQQALMASIPSRRLRSAIWNGPRRNGPRALITLLRLLTFGRWLFHRQPIDPSAHQVDGLLRQLGLPKGHGWYVNHGTQQHLV